MTLEVSLIAKALGDENRLRIIMMVHKQKLCACQLTEALGLASSTVSKHISVLRKAGLIDCVKNGRWCWYSIAAKPTTTAQEALNWSISALRADLIFLNTLPGPNMMICPPDCN